jgi:hypothetical protein
MDLLDNYKKAWDNQPEEMKKISALEIYKMTQAKSSSIIKWIFVIGLLEFAFMILSTFIFDVSNDEKIMMAMGVYELVQISQYLTIPVLFYFLFLFYKNYKNSGKKSESLRLSKLDYLDDATISSLKKSPYYWASFIYIGEITNVNSQPISYWWLLIAFIILYELTVLNNIFPDESFFIIKSP